jgi:hypothetical protein
MVHLNDVQVLLFLDLRGRRRARRGIGFGSAATKQGSGHEKAGGQSAEDFSESFSIYVLAMHGSCSPQSISFASICWCLLGMARP